MMTRTPAFRVRRAAARGDFGAALGALMLLIVIGFCLVVPLLPQYDPFGQDLGQAFLPPLTHSDHVLGTDSLGRDVASRLALGGLISLGLVLVIVVVNMVIGLVIGTVAGYYGGRVENVLMGWADTQLSMPVILIVIGLSAVLAPGVWLMTGVLCVTVWVAYARLCRAIALSLRGRDFVLASKLFGAGSLRVMGSHVVPHAITPLIVLASADIGNLIIAVTSFDYLGLGVQAPTPSWGLMISEGQRYLMRAPNLAIVPGIAMFFVIFGLVLLSQRFIGRNGAGIGSGWRAPRQRVSRSVRSARATSAPTAETAGAESPELLVVSGLTVGYTTDAGETITIVDSVSFTVRREEVFCIVGESGSGKSVLVLAVLGLLPAPLTITAGSVRLEGRELVGLPERELRRLRGRSLGMIFQDPMTSLNPVHRVGAQIARSLALHQRLSAGARQARMVELLDEVGVPQPAQRSRAYPHQWSGGMRQRAMIAMAMANRPALLIADEPTTALDVTIQAQIMDALAQARRVTGAAMVLITHDIGLVAQHADRIMVMYSGRVAETGTVWQIFDEPRHPYTIGLLRSLPSFDRPVKKGAAYAIPGRPPTPLTRGQGCAFEPRCEFAGKTSACAVAVPPLVAFAPGHLMACPPAAAAGDEPVTRETAMKEPS